MGQIKKVPMRQCIGCREMKTKKEMLRVIKTNEDEILTDTTGKKNGRGAYICYNSQCLDMAIKSKGLEKALKTKIPEQIYTQLKKEFDEFE